MDINKFDKIKKALEIYLRKIYSKLSSSIDASNKTLDRDLKNVMKSIWVEDDGIIRINYSNMSDDGLDADIIEKYITLFLKKLNIKLIPYNKRTGRDEDEDSLELYKENKMKANKLKQMIKEELAIIKESAVKRWVATVEFYVHAENEDYANQKVQQIMNMIDEQYDNHPSVVDLKPQQFGKIGMGEANIPGEEGYVMDVIKDEKAKAIVDEYIKILRTLRDVSDSIEDGFDSNLERANPAQLLKVLKNPKLKNVMIRYMEMDNKLNRMQENSKLKIAKMIADRYSEIYEL